MATWVTAREFSTAMSKLGVTNEDASPGILNDNSKRGFKHTVFMKSGEFVGEIQDDGLNPRSHYLSDQHIDIL